MGRALLARPLLMDPASPSDDDTRLVYVRDPDRTHAVRTTKYSLLTFIPRNLFEQFRRLAYFYFLVLVLLNQIPQLSVFGRATAFVPLGVVLVLTAAKDAYEDFRRHRSDTAENNRTAHVLQNSTFLPKRWRDVRVGEVLRVAADESIPCDMVLLSTSDPTGLAFVQTINLDGESNLKTRYALLATAALPSQSLDALIRCERPNLDIYAFHATIELAGSRFPLGPNNVVLRGCAIKNTAWAVGVAVYTGMETKVMLNNSGPPSKRSRLETRMNGEIIALAAIMVVLCSVVASLTGVWLRAHNDELDDLPYYRKIDYSKGEPRNWLYSVLGLEILFAFLKSIFLFQNFIPISLYISMELARLWQSYRMIQDRSMYHEATDSWFQCRALNICEDLGQIKYVFSDKTGTLTENKMEFRCVSIGGVDYSNGEPPFPCKVVCHPTLVGGQIWKPKVTVNTDVKLLQLLESGKGTEEGTHAHNFFLALTTCNTIVPQLVETTDSGVKLMDYQGESPDEQALVYAAAAYGFVLIERTSGHITIDVLGERQSTVNNRCTTVLLLLVSTRTMVMILCRFDILGLHEFDSDRKRMSVIVGCPDKTVKLFLKGADTSMFTITENSLNRELMHATERHLHTYSTLGLRTLVIGMRELNVQDFEEWRFAYEQASTTLAGRTDLLTAVAVKVEHDINILGASGIEDRLQQGVSEAIESLRQAGIKVWVLTGDKQETAISIGYSCKLITDDMTQIIINSHSIEYCKMSLEEAVSMTRKLLAASSRSLNADGNKESTIPLALVIDGPTLVIILKTELEAELFEVATACDAVLCCRVAPLQKAGIAELIKKRANELTLSIGDGANDVSMIQMADVGIGISGREGRQAVMASDFAMGQFRFLVPLLLVHGHWNYRRMAYMILYNFYRNAVFVFMIYWYSFVSAYSLLSPMNDINGLLYSSAYTAVLTIVVGTYDEDLSRITLLKYPQLYGVGLRDQSYNFRLSVFIMLDSIWQSLVMFYILFFAYRQSTIDVDSFGDVWILTVVLLVNLHLAMDVFCWKWKLHGSIWGCTLITFLCVIAIDTSPTAPGYRSAIHLLATKLFWVILLIILVSAFLPRFVAKVFRAYLQPDDIQIAREFEKIGNRNEEAAAGTPLNSSTDPHQEPQ